MKYGVPEQLFGQMWRAEGFPAGLWLQVFKNRLNIMKMGA